MLGTYPYFSSAAEALRQAGYRYDADRAIWRDTQGSAARIKRRWHIVAGSRQRRIEYEVERAASASAAY